MTNYSISKRQISIINNENFDDMMKLQTTLEQWQALSALATGGSVTAAADRLGKSQSTVSYLIAQLQTALGADLVMRKGRRAVLSEAGEILLERAERLLDETRDLEALAGQLAQGREAVVRLAVDTAFPAAKLVRALALFEADCLGTRLEVHEAALSGVNELLIAGVADVALGLAPPPGYLADPIIEIEFLLVVKKGHRLLELGRALTAADLEQETQVVIRDSGPEDLSRGWLSPTRRWSVSNGDAALKLIRSGLCYGRLPRHTVEDEVALGHLALLPMVEGASYCVTFYLTRSRNTGAGPAATQLMNILKKVAAVR